MTPEEAVEVALSEDKPTPPVSLVSEQPPARAQPTTLTRREEEVALLVASGLTNRRIAQRLHLSERTVTTHVRNILKKLGMSSRK